MVVGTLAGVGLALALWCFPMLWLAHLAWQLSRSLARSTTVVLSCLLAALLCWYTHVPWLASLLPIGTLFFNGSLSENGALLYDGSLPKRGTLTIVGSLLRFGTLAHNGSLCRYGTLSQLGSLRFVGAISGCGSLNIHGTLN